MLFFKQMVSHPIFLSCMFLAAMYFFSWRKQKYKALLSLILSVLLILLCTPHVSILSLKTLAHLHPVTPGYCSGKRDHKTILLPGGLYTKEGVDRLASWSTRRADVVIDLVKKGLTKLIIIPGGYGSEGQFLQKYISKRVQVEVIVGNGSSNTYGNFNELTDQLGKGSIYWLATSYWHYPRAYMVANKKELRVCPAVTSFLEPKHWLYHKDSHWHGKAALHEYMAMMFYWVTNKI
jgi:hypothetical protein